MKKNRKPIEQHSLHVKKGDQVILTSGKDRGQTGTVKEVITSCNKVVVEGRNMVTKAQKPNPMAGIQGGLIKVEAPVDSSKVMLYCPACEKATRIKHEIVEGKKVRVCKHCGEQL